MCTQEHVIRCPKLCSLIRGKDQDEINPNVEHNWIFSNDVEKQLLVTRSYNLFRDTKNTFLSQMRSQGTRGMETQETHSSMMPQCQADR